MFVNAVEGDITHRPKTRHLGIGSAGSQSKHAYDY